MEEQEVAQLQQLTQTLQEEHRQVQVYSQQFLVELLVETQVMVQVAMVLCLTKLFPMEEQVEQQEVQHFQWQETEEMEVFQAEVAVAEAEVLQEVVEVREETG
jgi:hypothetical protein